jgi:hypothetical protein
MSGYPPAEHSLARLVQLMNDLINEIGTDSTYYPWLVIPPQGKAFDANSTPPIVTPTVAAGETEVLRLVVPQGWDGIIKRLSNTYIGGTNPDTTQSLTWRIYLDQQLVPNYGNIKTQFGSTQFPRETDGIFISSGQTVRWTVTNTDVALPTPGTYCSCCLAGFWWPRQQS